jgi:hypothetical protein
MALLASAMLLACGGDVLLLGQILEAGPETSNGAAPPVEAGDGPGHRDASTGGGDADLQDAPGDSPGIRDVSSDARDGSGSTLYSDLSSVADWAAFDPTTVSPRLQAFSGATFDGRYVYFVNYGTSTPNGVIGRLDTTGNFVDKSSWSFFDAQTLDGRARIMNGAVFDGRYAYFIPDGSGLPDGVVVRLDTTADFSSASSWSTFDTTTVTPAASGFGGGTFDGRYLYLVPFSNTNVPTDGGSQTFDGVVTRYDTTAGFTSPASWSTFDVATVNAKATGFWGAIFDGQAVYFLPNGNPQTGAAFVRYDTTASFSAPASWSTFDTSALTPHAFGFSGGAFDGRYLYTLGQGWPADASAAANHTYVARCDTHAGFTNAGSWVLLDGATVGVGVSSLFWGGNFDGRYVYVFGNGSSNIVRFDSTASFSSPASWTTFDTKSITGIAYHSTFSSVFDGRYLYVAPVYDQPLTILRFHAKEPRSMPALPAFSGSFF